MADRRDDLLMTPGPTAIPESVRSAMAKPPQNPDVDPAFTAFYRDLQEKLQSVDHTDHDIHVLSGEGMLGLEASLASILEPGDQVLCLANGRYGRGFADLVDLHGGEPVLVEGPSDQGLPVDAIADVLENESFTAATMVHCETPTGVLNDLDEILDHLQTAGILTVVDAVSSIGGVPVPVDRIDLCLGASQKCFSAPPGLATLAVSDRAWDRIAAVEQRSFYTSLEPWRTLDLSGDEAVLLPYTPPVSNLYALDAALDRLLDEGMAAVFDRHERAAERCRSMGRALDLELHPSSDAIASPTVTAFRIEGSATALQRRLADRGVVVATGLGDLEDDILRVGHMGHNADIEKVERTMDAVAETLN